MNYAPTSLNSLWADLIIRELIRNRIRYFCLSPGSRSTPLASAVAFNDGADSLMHFDERATAYHALGYARAAGLPAVLICTSGTAVANYLPAVVEASIDMVPMIILTADRPPELRQSFANQTIDQVKIFNDYVRWHFDLPCPDEKIPAEFVLTTIDQAVYRSTRKPAGPVHINCMFREPLIVDEPRYEGSGCSPAVAAWKEGKRPYTDYKPPCSLMPADRLADLASVVNRASRGLLIVGRLKHDEQQAVSDLSERLGWPVLPDIGSGLRLGVRSANVIPYYDQLLLHRSAREIDRPLILHIGGRLTSKRLLQFLEGALLEQYIMVADHPFRHDPSHRVTTRIEADVPLFCRSLASLLSPHRGHELLEKLRATTLLIDRVLDEVIGATGRLSEPACARLVSRLISPGSGLFLANSMPVRDMDMFADFKGPAVHVGCNRGASGIDGTISAASGLSAGLNMPATLLIGDLAFLHDLNALAMLGSLKNPVIAVVLNNNGGGIFSFLPAAECKEIFEPFFAAPHNLGFEKAAGLFNIDYYAPETQDSFASCYKGAQEKGRSAIIEVKGDRNDNYEIHQAIQRRIVEALDEI